MSYDNESVSITREAKNTRLKNPHIIRYVRFFLAVCLILMLRLDMPIVTAGAQGPNYTAYTDVPTSSPYYSAIQYMTDNRVMSGYSTNPPCDTGIPCFRPNDNATRGAICKIIVNAESLPTHTPYPNWTFTDVPPDNTFYSYVETIYYYGIAIGYPCGDVGEPCDSQSRRYFHVGYNATRGQVAKMIVKASHEIRAFLNPPDNTFTDVPVGSTFFQYVETVAGYNEMQGHPCDGLGEPCDPQNRQYFGVNTLIVHGDVAKSVFLDTLFTVGFGHNSAYPGSNNYYCHTSDPSSCSDPNATCSPPDPAFLPGVEAAYNDDYGAYTKYVQMGREMSFDANAKNWLVCASLSNSLITMAFHAQNNGGQGCTNGEYYQPLFSTNLPGPITFIVKPACGLDQSEARIKSGGAPVLLTDSAGYFAQVVWLGNESTGYNGQLNIDNYLLNGSSVLHRDFMQKLCYTQGSDGSSHPGAKYGVWSCDAPSE